jgi:hypothetical protein
MPRSNQTLLRFGAIVLPMVLLTVAARSALKPSQDVGSVPSGIPSVEELDSLGKYLKPRPSQGVPALVRADRITSDVYDPFDSPDFLSNVASGTGAVAVPQPVRERYVVTAILISRDRRVAVIDDALVSVGSVLPGGIRVVGIEADHVAVVGPRGIRRVLTIKDTSGP